MNFYGRDYRVWHFDVIPRGDNELILLFNVATADKANYYQYLGIGQSLDGGHTWNLSPRPLWIGGTDPDAWLYRPTGYIETDKGGSERIVMYFPYKGHESGGNQTYWHLGRIMIYFDAADIDYVCGDANFDFTVNIGDVVYVIMYSLMHGPPPLISIAADANCDGEVNVGDAVFLSKYIFFNGPFPCSPCP